MGAGSASTGDFLDCHAAGFGIHNQRSHLRDNPFILISDPSSKWPSPYVGDVDFSRFRTIEAQDLIKVHDSFTASKFSRAFVDKFNTLRESRNSLMHSVNASLQVNYIDVVESLLFMHKELFPREAWAKLRRESLEVTPGTELGEYQYV